MVINNTIRDRALFARIAEGYAAAFESLFTVYVDSLKANAFKVLKSEFWAEEVVQEAFTKVWDKRDRLPDIDNPAGWLYKICANDCLDRIRRQKSELQYQYLEHSGQLGMASTDFHPRYDVDLLQKLVHEAISKLPERQRLVYQLQQEEDLSYKEIAGRLGISWHTVRNHLIQAHQTIREHVQAHGEFSLLLLAFLPFF